MALSLAAQAFQDAIAAAKANPPAAVVAAGITYLDLGDYLDGNIPEPEILVDDLIYTEGVHLVSGHPGHGKTTIVQHMAHMTMSQGGHCVWLDYEAGVRGTVRRLLALGIPKELLRTNFHYSPWPVAAEKHLAGVAAQYPGALIVLDSMSKALAAAGISENANDEVTGWTVQVVKACKDFALPIVIIDHVAKTGTGEYSRGAGAKLADVDVHWGVVRTSVFNRERSGTIEIHQKKDREGYLPFTTWWRVGDGHGALDVTRLEGPPDPEDDTAPSI